MAFYHRDFGKPLNDWTHAAMRGHSSWTVGERELMAAMVATWTSCAFCKGAHRAIAAKELPTAMVDAALSNFETAPLSSGFRAALTFLQKMTVRPSDLKADDARAVLRSGVTEAALIDAIAVGTLFNVITRYADALGFAIPTPKEFDRSADMLLRRGYR
jgi:uncharacterized peroxidase-related enzyme